MTHAHLTDEERELYTAALSVRHGPQAPLDYLIAIHRLKTIIDRLTAAPAETPAQDATDEVAKDTVLRLFSEMHDKAADKGLAYNVEKFADAVVAALLKQRRLVTRERIVQTYNEWRAYGKGDDPEELADALLSADLGFKVVSRADVKLALDDKFAEIRPYKEWQVDNIMRLIADGSAK